jgi:hypothetical protein
MKLLYIGSKSERSIDECLMIVPADYVEAEALERAEEAGVESPFVENVIDIEDRPFASFPATWRTYIG